LTEIAAALRPEIDWDEEEIERVLLLVQTLEPVGVGARNLAECLGIQLAQLDSSTPGLSLARRIAESHLDLLAQRDPSPLRTATGAEEDEIMSSATGFAGQRLETGVRGTGRLRASER
jgi:RNA polymerase sigma-54 factor